MGNINISKRGQYGLKMIKAHFDSLKFQLNDYLVNKTTSGRIHARYKVTEIKDDFRLVSKVLSDGSISNVQKYLCDECYWTWELDKDMITSGLLDEPEYINDQVLIESKRRRLVNNYNKSIMLKANSVLNVGDVIFKYEYTHTGYEYRITSIHEKDQIDYNGKITKVKCMDVMSVDNNVVTKDVQIRWSWMWYLAKRAESWTDVPKDLYSAKSLTFKKNKKV